MDEDKDVKTLPVAIPLDGAVRPPEFGDMVLVKIPRLDPWEALVLGVMSYANDGDVLLLGEGITFGMPCNRQWCSVIGSKDLFAASRLRAAYLNRYPESLRPNV